MDPNSSANRRSPTSERYRRLTPGDEPAGFRRRDEPPHSCKQMTPSLQRRCQLPDRANVGGGGSPVPTKDSGTRHGAFMEPSGRNRWQPVASGSPPKNGSNKPFGNRWQRTATVPERMVKSTFATACHRLPTTPYLLERESTSW